MNLPPSEIGELSWYEFQALCWHYNDIHSTEDDAPEAISAEDYEVHLARLAARGELKVT